MYVKFVFCKDLQDKLESNNYQTKDTTIDKHWEVFRDIVHSTAHTHLGTVKRRNQDWFDENDTEIQKLLSEKHQLLREYPNHQNSTTKKEAFSRARRNLQKKLREIRNKWFNTKADEIQALLTTMT